MLMMRVVVVGFGADNVTVALSLPPGVDIDEVDGATLKANGTLSAAKWEIDPRSDRASDLFRGFRAGFPRRELTRAVGPDRVMRVTGRLRNGREISGWCELPDGWATHRADGRGPARRDVDAPAGGG